MSTIDNVLENHLDAFANQELDEIMADYGEDSVVVTNVGVFRGLDEIERLFTDVCSEFSQDGTSIDFDDTIVEDKFAYLLWHGETPDNVYEFCTDTFYIPEETIEFQTFAGNIKPKS